MEKIHNAVNAICRSQMIIPDNTWEFVDSALKHVDDEQYSNV